MKIEFSTESAAFLEPYTGEADSIYRDMEIKRILEEIMEKIECGLDHGTIMDINGHKVGKWKI